MSDEPGVVSVGWCRRPALSGTDLLDFSRYEELCDRQGIPPYPAWADGEASNR